MPRAANGSCSDEVALQKRGRDVLRSVWTPHLLCTNRPGNHPVSQIPGLPFSLATSYPLQGSRGQVCFPAWFLMVLKLIGSRPCTLRVGRSLRILSRERCCSLYHVHVTPPGRGSLSKCRFYSRLGAGPETAALPSSGEAVRLRTDHTEYRSRSHPPPAPPLQNRLLKEHTLT